MEAGAATEASGAGAAPGASVAAGASADAEGAHWGGSSVVVIACGLSDDHASVTAGHVKRCLYRLHGAARDGKVVPGGGAAEMACVAALEREAAQHASNASPPLTVTTMAISASELESVRRERRRGLRAEGMALVSSALRQLLCRRARNTGASASELATVVAVSGAHWSQLGEVEDALRDCANRHKQAALFQGVEWAPLCAWVGDATRGGRAEPDAPPLDLLTAKAAVLRASVDVLEQALLPDTVVSNAGP